MVVKSYLNLIKRQFLYKLITLSLAQMAGYISKLICCFKGGNTNISIFASNEKHESKIS